MSMFQQGINFFNPNFSYLIFKQSIFEASKALQKWEGMILMKRMSFCWFLRNSEVEASWISLIRWPHKGSNTQVMVDALQTHSFTDSNKNPKIQLFVYISELCQWR